MSVKHLNIWAYQFDILGGSLLIIREIEKKNQQNDRSVLFLKQKTRNSHRKLEKLGLFDSYC